MSTQSDLEVEARLQELVGNLGRVHPASSKHGRWGISIHPAVQTDEVSIVLGLPEGSKDITRDGQHQYVHAINFSDAVIERAFQAEQNAERFQNIDFLKAKTWQKKSAESGDDVFLKLRHLWCHYEEYKKKPPSGFVLEIAYNHRELAYNEAFGLVESELLCQGKLQQFKKDYDLGGTGALTVLYLFAPYDAVNTARLGAATRPENSTFVSEFGNKVHGLQQS